MICIAYDHLRAALDSAQSGSVETLLVFPGEKSLVVLQESVEIVIYRIRRVREYQISTTRSLNDLREIRFMKRNQLYQAAALSENVSWKDSVDLIFVPNN